MGNLFHHGNPFDGNSTIPNTVFAIIGDLIKKLTLYYQIQYNAIAIAIIVAFQLSNVTFKDKRHFVCESVKCLFKQ